ncbi:unnamed protein product [Amoebophrya sp. A25]|nr:unnamed protein product [Amoebophrya sp. A25]|eukprot:GSA25T00007572001.1
MSRFFKEIKFIIYNDINMLHTCCKAFSSVFLCKNQCNRYILMSSTSSTISVLKTTTTAKKSQLQRTFRVATSPRCRTIGTASSTKLKIFCLSFLALTIPGDHTSLIN